MDGCKGGCGEPTSSGDFVADHSQKLMASLVNEVGGLFALQELVQYAKKYSSEEKEQEEFLDVIRRIFPVKNLRQRDLCYQPTREKLFTHDT